LLAPDTARAASEETDPVLTVAALISAFESDKASASEKLKGKPVAVRDVVERVGKHDISLRNPATKDKNSVKCKFGRDYGGPIQVGSTVTVKGTLDKRGVTGTIGLNECVVVASGQD
jgi:hypothetical protein